MTQVSLRQLNDKLQYFVNGTPIGNLTLNPNDNLITTYDGFSSPYLKLYDGSNDVILSHDGTHNTIKNTGSSQLYDLKMLTKNDINDTSGGGGHAGFGSGMSVPKFGAGFDGRNTFILTSNNRVKLNTPVIAKIGLSHAATDLAKQSNFLTEMYIYDCVTGVFTLYTDTPGRYFTQTEDLVIFDPFDLLATQPYFPSYESIIILNLRRQALTDANDTGNCNSLFNFFNVWIPMESIL